MALVVLAPALENLPAGQNRRCLRDNCREPAGLEVPLDDREPSRWFCIAGHSGLVLLRPPAVLRPSDIPPNDRGLRAERRATGRCLGCGARARPFVYCRRCRLADQRRKGRA